MIQAKFLVKNNFLYLLGLDNAANRLAANNTWLIMEPVAVHKVSIATVIQNLSLSLMLKWTIIGWKTAILNEKHKLYDIVEHKMGKYSFLNDDFKTFNKMKLPFKIIPKTPSMINNENKRFLLKPSKTIFVLSSIKTVLKKY